MSPREEKLCGGCGDREQRGGNGEFRVRRRLDEEHSSSEDDEDGEAPGDEDGGGDVADSQRRPDKEEEYSLPPNGSDGDNNECGSPESYFKAGGIDAPEAKRRRSGRRRERKKVRDVSSSTTLKESHPDRAAVREEPRLHSEEANSETTSEASSLSPFRWTGDADDARPGLRGTFPEPGRFLRNGDDDDYYYYYGHGVDRPAQKCAAAPPPPAADAAPIPRRAAPVPAEAKAKASSTGASRALAEGAAEEGGGLGGLKLAPGATAAAAYGNGNGSATAAAAAERRKLKGGLTLVFTPDDNAADRFWETSQEERRAALPRYRWALLSVMGSMRKRTSEAAAAVHDDDDDDDDDDDGLKENDCLTAPPQCGREESASASTRLETAAAAAPSPSARVRKRAAAAAAERDGHDDSDEQSDDRRRLLARRGKERHGGGADRERARQTANERRPEAVFGYDDVADDDGSTCSSASSSSSQSTAASLRGLIENPPWRSTTTASRCSTIDSSSCPARPRGDRADDELVVPPSSSQPQRRRIAECSSSHHQRLPQESSTRLCQPPKNSKAEAGRPEAKCTEVAEEREDGDAWNQRAIGGRGQRGMEELLDRRDDERVGIGTNHSVWCDAEGRYPAGFYNCQITAALPDGGSGSARGQYRIKFGDGTTRWPVSQSDLKPPLGEDCYFVECVVCRVRIADVDLYCCDGDRCPNVYHLRCLGEGTPERRRLDETKDDGEEEWYGPCCGGGGGDTSDRLDDDGTEHGAADAPPRALGWQKGKSPGASRGERPTMDAEERERAAERAERLASELGYSAALEFDVLAKKREDGHGGNTQHFDFYYTHQKSGRRLRSLLKVRQFLASRGDGDSGDGRTKDQPTARRRAATTETAMSAARVAWGQKRIAAAAERDDDDDDNDDDRQKNDRTPRLRTRKLRRFKEQHGQLHGHFDVKESHKELVRRTQYMQRFYGPERRKKWDEKFELLRHFKAENGHVRVPAMTPLGQWVRKQRASHHDLTMPKERFEKLKKLGFVWHILDRRWEDNFELLLRFKAEHGHVRVSQETKLGFWVAQQRLVLKKSAMPQKRRERLEKIGFEWDYISKLRDQQWEDNFERLLQFKAKEGHVCVPLSTKLGTWVGNQRQRHTTMPKERYDRLDKLGFVWKIDMPGIRSRQWLDNFEKLRQFKAQYGHTRVPNSTSLGQWVKKQRSLGRRSKLSQDRLSRLEKLGFDI